MGERRGCQISPGKEPCARSAGSGPSRLLLVSAVASCAECNTHLRAHVFFIVRETVRKLFVLKRTCACYRAAAATLSAILAEESPYVLSTVTVTA